MSDASELIPRLRELEDKLSRALVGQVSLDQETLKRAGLTIYDAVSVLETQHRRIRDALEAGTSRNGAVQRMAKILRGLDD